MPTLICFTPAVQFNMWLCDGDTKLCFSAAEHTNCDDLSYDCCVINFVYTIGDTYCNLVILFNEETTWLQAFFIVLGQETIFI